MQLSRRISLFQQKENRRLVNLRTRKKHKKLDSICENVYNLNHKKVKIENNADPDEVEPRRSTRVRRAPEVLDASPSPAKKRRRVEFRREKVKDESGCSTSGKVERELGSWGDRLRTRGLYKKGKSLFSKGKKRLFSSDDVVLESSMSTVVKPKRPGRIKASNIVKNEERESSSDEGEASEDFEENKIKSEASDHEENNEVEEGETGKSDEDGDDIEENEDGKSKGETSESDEDGEDDKINDIRNHISEKEAQESGEDDVEMGLSSESDEEKNEVGDDEEKIEVGDDEANDEVDVNEKKEKEEIKDTNDDNENKENNTVGEITERNEVQDHKETDEVTITLENSIADRENQMESPTVGVSSVKLENRKSDEKHLGDKNAEKIPQINNEKRYLRVGRRCGLCGTGTDGKPPKTLVEDGSDHEVAYSGSSASEDVRYDTYDGFDGEPGWLGRLLGPINDRHGIAGIFVHQNCAVWSPEVYFAGLGCLKNVRAALCRGRVLKCARCSRPGATIGCRVDRCPKTYHLPCARANGCIFDHRKFLIACTDHRHLFQPHGVQYLHKIKKLKTKKLKLEMRKVSGDAWRKDLEAEEKYLENCGEDEEFLKRESKRLHRDLLRIAPVYIGGSSSDKESQFQGWESVAGLQNVIQSLKEVVILPLLYPEFFSNMGLTPPRGVLLHGYPGTGKTLVVRALIGACAHGDKRIAYFARKGADCLGKYVGDAERQLRLLFQVAEKSQPSIIFFDEIDGLAPCRTRQQDQTHNSVVSTLLALMDGLKSRGSVVVIGATNRPDSVDSALRRPGRFDREIYFPLPSAQDREAILSLHTKKWPKPVTGLLLKQIAKKTVGFAGADLQSLCTQAAITALRRSCPFQEILSAAENKGISGKHPPLPTFVVEERDWLGALRKAPPPCSQRGTEMAANDVVSSPLHAHLIPCLLKPLFIFLSLLSRDERIFLPSMLYKAVMMVKGVVISALDRKKIPSYDWLSHVQDVLQEEDVLRDAEIKLSCSGIINGMASDLNSYVSDDKLEFNCPKVQQVSTRPSLWKNEKKIGFCLLISGSPRSGQRYLASCLLHCFTGNIEIQKLDSATISQKGQGDSLQGVTRILMKCASVGSSLIFMPRIDLWAIESYSQIEGVENDSSTKNSELPGQEEPEVSEMATSEDVLFKTSLIWNIFVEQVDSISVTSSLTILATSELPLESLPDGIRQFFKTENSNSRSSFPSEETIPRFSIHLDGHVNRDSMINSSAMELSKDLVQQFVQLTHHKAHIHSSPCIDVKNCGALEENADNNKPADEVENSKIPESSFMQFSSPKSRPSRGKSNLMSTFCTLGYQILRYPHFAELCWATSKLKEGPCTNTKGPWKGWPFNSCIVRPDKSSERAISSSSNIKNRETYGLVRGLIAVGLLAFRGTYTTVLEVSAEVRKVLELLADQINAKIRSGKDPHQYIRLLSQMAYFEDVVNSWAYSLQSLEDTQATIPPTSSLTNLESRDNLPFEDSLEKKDNGETNVFAKSSYDITEQKNGSESAKSSDPLLEKNTQNFDLNEVMEEDSQNPEGRIILDEPPEQILCSNPISVSSKKVGNNSGQCTLEIPDKYPIDNGVCASIISNGFVNTETVVIDEDGKHSGDMSSEDALIFNDSSNQQNDKPIETNILCENGKLSSIDGRTNDESSSSAGNGNSFSNDSGVICFDRCCAECLIKLRQIIGKILNCKWGSRDDGGFTVEDVHDLVASVSMNLLASLRNIFIDELDKCEEEKRQNNIRGVLGNQENDPCQCKKDSEDGSLRPKECGCHSTTTLSQNSRNENALQFICRDGLVSEVSSQNFHCKFETICLCSLIEWIGMAKQPSG